MKKLNYLIKCICATLLIAVAVLGSSAAISADDVYVGYANPKETVYPYTGFNNGIDQTGMMHFAVHIDADKLALFAGQKLLGIHVGWSQGSVPRTPEMKAFVRESLNGEDLASGTKNVSFGWNDIAFDEPYIIEAGKDIYIGGEVLWEPDAWLATGIFGYNLPAGSQYIFVGEQDETNIAWEEISQSEYTLLLLGIVQAEGEEFQNIGNLTSLRTNELQGLEKPGTAFLTIQNQGINAINSIEISGQFGDKTWSYPLTLSKPIDGNSSASLRGPVQALGVGTHKFWLSKINDIDVKSPAKIDVGLIGISEEVASKYTRRPLVEYWVSESNYRTPIYVDQWFAPGLPSVRDGLSVTAHHMSDQFMTYLETSDPDIDNEEVQLLLDFAGGMKQYVFCPVFTLDRSFIPENLLAKATDQTIAYNFMAPEVMPDLYKTAMNVPTFVSVKAAASHKDNAVDVTVSGNIEPGILDEEPLYLSVYLIEDGIESDSQEFPDDEQAAAYNGVYTHNDLVRAQAAPLYGENIGSAGAFSKKVTFDIDEEWNLEHMRVLAFVNRDGKNHNHAQVLNSTELSLDPTGVETVSADSDVRIVVAGNDILVLGAYSEACAYSISGAKTGLRALSPGIYVVKVATADGTVVRKVVIK